MATLLPVLVGRGACALTGPAGSGKTFALKRCIAEARICGLKKIVLAAPTWRALNVALQAIGEEDLPHATTAGLLKLKPSICPETGKIKFGRTYSNYADALAGHRVLAAGCDLLIVEEASMVSLLDGRVLQRLSRHLGAAILFCGDPAQLGPVGSNQQMAIQDPWLEATTAKLETVHRNAGEILKLATKLRTHGSVHQQWPATSQLDPGGQSGVIVHPDLESWTRAAVSVLGSAAFDADPSIGRVLAWSNRTVDSVAADIRRRRYGRCADQWQHQEWLSAPNGLPCPGQALGTPREPACAELRIVAVGEPQRLSRQGQTFIWRTPSKGLEREITISAEADVVELQVQRAPGAPVHRIFAEFPGKQTWSTQLKAIRADVKAHLTGADRAAAMGQLADFESLVPKTRPLLASTLHASQGGSMGDVFLHNPSLLWCTGDELRPLAYVGVSRARHKLHIVRSRTA